MIDLIGKKFGRLSVIGQEGRYNTDKLWLCECDCGNKAIVSGCNLRNGSTKSCGCIKKEGNNLKHGHDKIGKQSRTYHSWRAMIQRCQNPNNIKYKYYGEKEISVCKRWSNKKNGFINFLKDMGDRPKGKTLDRIDNNLGYYKDNCRWATIKEQNNNRRPRKLGYKRDKYKIKNIFINLKTLTTSVEGE